MMARGWKRFFRKRRWLTLLMLLLPLLFIIALTLSPANITTTSWSQEESKMYMEDVGSKAEREILITEVKLEVGTKAFEPNRDFEAKADQPDQRLWNGLHELGGTNEKKQPAHVRNELEEQKQNHDHIEDTMVNHNRKRQKGEFEIMRGKENRDSEPVGLESQKARELKFDIVMAIPNGTMEEKYRIHQENKEMAWDYKEEEKLSDNHKEERHDDPEINEPRIENEAKAQAVHKGSVPVLTQISEIDKNRPPEEAPQGLLRSKESLGTVKEEGSHPMQGDAISKAPTSNVLLLSSLGRSGSSFLGGLLSSLPGVFYFFEPLHYLAASHLLTEEVTVQSLRALFTCNIDGLILEALQKLKHFTIRHKYLKTCKKKCFNSHLLNSACRNESIRVVKTIRMQVTWLPPLLEDADSNLKVIHLVRDPRPTLLSSWRLGWNITQKMGCSMISHNLQTSRNLAALYPGRYFMVRYEDLCGDPWGMARIIFSHLGYTSLPPSSVSFLRTNINGKGSGSPYGIKRKISLMQQKWRKIISQEQLTNIERDCASTILDIGFSLFHDLDTVRNLSVPLYRNSTTSQFFLYSNVG